MAEQIKLQQALFGYRDGHNLLAASTALTPRARQFLATITDSSGPENNREFEAINKEIEMQVLETKLSEKHIKDASEEISDKARLLENAKKNIGAKETNLKHKKGELEKIIAETEKEEQEFRDQATKAKEKVDPRLLASYERIRKNYRNGLAVVPIVRDACGGCFNAIPPQRQSEIRQRKKIIVCENCGRILVDEELPEIAKEK